jgi:hypothetical protein
MFSFSSKNSLFAFNNVIIIHLSCLSRHQPRSQGFRVKTRGETRKPWSGPVTSLQNMDIFDSYSSRNDEIFLAEIYKYSKQITSQKTSQSILFVQRSLAWISWNLWRHRRCFLSYTDISGDFPTTVTGKAKGISLQVVIHTKCASSRLEQNGYCL